MNKLEELIGKSWERNNTDKMPINPTTFALGFKSSMSLDLPVKFAEWLNKHWIPFDDGLW